MCGIVGYVGQRDAQQLLLRGLQRLEYRGYDSAGITLLEGGAFATTRAVGNLANLRAALAAVPARVGSGDAAGFATTGIGHTRWATHGVVAERNAHPHGDTADDVHVVVNGIVENYVALREELRAAGAIFTSDTDAEVVAHLVAHAYEGDLAAAVRSALTRMHGHFAFVVVHRDEPDLLVGTRRECPLVVGVADGEAFFGSSTAAFAGDSCRALYLEDDQVAILRADSIAVLGADGNAVAFELRDLDDHAVDVERGGFETYMLKEIHEQGAALEATIAAQRAEVAELDDLLGRAERVVMVGCGTSYHAALVGRYAIQQWSRVPVELDIASEFRYRNPVFGPNDLVIGMTQSGETADTLAAMRLARANGASVLAITNVPGSQATRDSDAVLLTRAGLEVGVAATKTFVCQVATMYLLALRLTHLRRALPEARIAELDAELSRLPALVDAVVAELSGEYGQIAEIARRHAYRDFFLYLGRNVGLPIALEGALKLKEISYIATDAYAAGEMKHGPIALLSEETPVVAIATESPVRDKMVSNMQEVRARGAHVIAIATEGDVTVGEHAAQVVRVPATDWMLQPLLAIVPLQLLAYEIAQLRGLNVDQPRNLAKTVTVE